MAIGKQDERHVKDEPLADSQGHTGNRNSEERDQAPGVWQNTVMTLKVLAGFALIGSAMWGLDLWVSGR